jgi:hypothetical protein
MGLPNRSECNSGQGGWPPWPVHPSPLEDELLSSWVARLAHANHQSAQTFAAVTWPGRQILHQGLDRTVDPEVLELLATRARVAPERVRATTLAAYAGWLCEVYARAQKTPWILSTGPQFRQRQGLPFCPACLAGPAPPYFRRRWRLAFVTAIEAPLAAALSFQKHLLAVLERGWTMMEPDKPIYSHLFFEGVHQLVRLLKADGRARGLEAAAREGLGLGPAPKAAEAPPRPSRAFRLQNVASCSPWPAGYWTTGPSASLRFAGKGAPQPPPCSGTWTGLRSGSGT